MTATQHVSSLFGLSNWVDMVQYRAQVQPEDSAFVYLTDGVSNELRLTNRELDRRSRAIGAWIQKHHLFGERVLLLYPPGLDFIAAFFGCLYGGAIAVPVYPPKRNRSMLRIEAVANSAQAKLALTTDDVLKRVNELISETPNLTRIPWLATTSLPTGFEDEWSRPEVDSDTLAFLQFTSGSTGTPKGVMLTHGNLLHNSMLIQQGFEHTRTDSGVFWLPSYHDMGLIGGILQPVYCGRPNVLMSPLSFLTKPLRWLSAISRYRGTTSGGPNFAYDLCVRQIKDEQLEGIDLSSWKVAFNGAEPVQAETLDRFTEKFEPFGFRYEAFYPCFGLAEGTLIVTGGTQKDKPVVRSFDADSLVGGRAIDAVSDATHVHRLVSSGRPIYDQRVAVVDPETRIECDPGTVGEIWTRSPSVAMGYWERPEATEETFRAHIADTNEGPFMRTGDLGFFLDGEFYITGRIKDLIIIRGVNVYPQDIELTAQKSHSLLRPNCGGAFMYGPAQKEKLALVQEVERKFKLEDADGIFAAVRKAIALEHEIPIDNIFLVRHGSVPKTSSGKVQRHACRTGFLEKTFEPVATWSLEVDGDRPLTSTASVSALPARSDQPQSMSVVFEIKKGTSDSKVVLPNAEKNVSAPLVPLMQLDYNETARIVLEEVYRVGTDRARNISLDTDITELGLDSLERMEILAGLEDRFGGQFPEEVLPTLFTAREVVEAVRRYLGGGIRVGEDSQSRKFELTDECWDVAKFPEYLKIHENVELVRRMKLNHFFEVHDGAAGATTEIGGKTFINYSSYNYIDSSGHPDVTKAAQDAVATYGTSVSASRIVAGEIPLHRQLENEISQFLGTEDTIVLVGGHQTNESIIGHMAGTDDLVLFDSLAHNSIVQGAILSGARRRPFPHGDWDAADRILEQNRDRYHRVLIALEGVYSMDGDWPDLPEFIRVKKKHKAMLMIDEAHSIGVLGATGRGIAEHFGIERRDVDIWMSTLSKTFGSCGGYISGRKELVEYLKYTAPAFMFSVGMPPAQAAAALASLKLLEREPERTEKIRANSRFFRELANKLGLNTGFARETAVVPVIIGNSVACLKISHMLFENGISAQPILHPAVEEKSARIRFFLSCAHTTEQLTYTLETLARIIQNVLKETN